MVSMVSLVGGYAETKKFKAYDNKCDITAQFSKECFLQKRETAFHP